MSSIRSIARLLNVVLISSVESRVRLLLMIATLPCVIRQKMKHVRRKLDMKNLLLFECLGICF